MERTSDFQLLLILALALALALLGATPSLAAPGENPDARGLHNPSAGLQLTVQKEQVVMDNGIVKVTMSNPTGFVLAVQYNGIDDILDKTFEPDERGYWDASWNIPGSKPETAKISSTKFEIIKQDKDQIEVSFSSVWSASQAGMPLNIDKRFVLLPGRSGFYCYAIYERVAGMPDLDVDETRVVFKLSKTKFRYMAVSDQRQRMMPHYEDRTSGEPLAYPEAVRLTNPIEPAMKGEVDDKYQYSGVMKDSPVHGWISFSPPLGFWMISPSNEFRTGGPTKQDLLSHVGPTTISMFVSLHYAGKVQGLQFREGKPWKKVFGPVFVYLNSKKLDDNPVTLWNDSKAQMLKETESWPYSFPLSKDFPRAADRGQASGQLLICDRPVKDCTPAAAAQVGLAPPGPAGSWETENQGYQFWTQADANGNFLIKAVRPGTYNLFAWAAGAVGDFVHNAIVTIKPGSDIKLGALQFAPPRSGPTLWEIGIPDRSAAEFFAPDPDPKLANPLYLKFDKFRQYGLWQRYTELYPKEDLVFTVGTSDYRKDWFYAHVNRIHGNSFQPTTWQIVFDLKGVAPTQTYVLRVAVAAANEANLQVKVKDANAQPVYIASLKQKDNAIARHGPHGLYSLHTANIPGSLLVNGQNRIFLTQVKNVGPFQGLMYDYLRLELASSSGP